MKYKSYDIEEHELTFALDTGGVMSVFMDAEIIEINGGEYDCNDDADMKDIIIMHGGKYYTLQNVVQWCEANHDDIRAQEIAEDGIEQAMLSETLLTARTGE